MRLCFDVTLLVAGLVIGLCAAVAIGPVSAWPHPADDVARFLSLALILLALLCLLVSGVARSLFLLLAPRPLKLSQLAPPTGLDARFALDIVSWYDQVVKKPVANSGAKPEYDEVVEACAEALFEQISASPAAPVLARAVQIAVRLSRMDTAAPRRGIDELAREAAQAVKRGKPFCPQAFVDRWERTRPELASCAGVDALHAFHATRLLAEIEQTRSSGRIVASADFAWLKRFDRPLWYAISGFGRPTPLVEGAGIISHYLAEKKANRALEVVNVGWALDFILDQMSWRGGYWTARTSPPETVAETTAVGEHPVGEATPTLEFAQD
jgi:hypothetical protein